MLFETERLLIRRWNEHDLADLHALYSDPGFCDDIRPELCLSETKKIFDAQLLNYATNSEIGRFFIIEKGTGLLIGTLLIRPIDENSEVEIGYAIKKSMWGKGLATEVVTGSITYFFTATNYNAIVALTAPQNLKSKKVLVKSGFFQEENVVEDGEEFNLFSLRKNQINCLYSNS